VPHETLLTLFPDNPTLVKKFLSSGKPLKEIKPKMVARPTVTRDDIEDALLEVSSDRFARYAGIISHLIYWTVFGKINQVPLEEPYKKDLFIATMQIKTEYDTKYSGKKKFILLVLPLIILALRIEMEVIFKNQYTLFFSQPVNEHIAMKSINQVITQLLDPNLFCSRFSFLESDKESISLKYGNNKKGIGLPALKAKYNGRSALIETLIPVPSEGRIRKMFNQYQPKNELNLPQVTKFHKSKSTTRLRGNTIAKPMRKGNCQITNI